MEEVVLTPESFQKNKSQFDLRTKTVKVPELNSLMNLPKGQIAVMKVKQLSLGEYLQTRIDYQDRVKNIIEGIMAASVNRDDVEEEVKKSWKKKTPEIQSRIDCVLSGLVEPKLSRSDIVFLCDKFPGVVTRLYQTIMELTDQGADLKKNSPA